MITNVELVEKCKYLASLPTIYEKGALNDPVNSKTMTTAYWFTSKHEMYAYNHKADRVKKLKAIVASDTYWAGDCVCSIKSIVWGWTGDRTKPHGGAVINSKQDVNADDLYKLCSNKSKDFSDLSKIPLGALLHMSGHVGIYVGDGLCFETCASGKDGSQLRGLLKACGGYAASNKFTEWGLLPADWVMYVKTPSVQTAPVTLKVGDTVVLKQDADVDNLIVQLLNSKFTLKAVNGDTALIQTKLKVNTNCLKEDSIRIESCKQFTVKVRRVLPLPYYCEPDENSGVNGSIKSTGVYTIVATTTDHKWGKLMSGVGYILLKDVDLV